MKRPYTFHRENCKIKVRRQYTSKNGFEVKVIGRHAFEWTAEIRNNYSFFSITFPNRVALKRELDNKYPQKCTRSTK